MQAADSRERRRDYYDEFSSHLLVDYAHDNARILSATRHALRSLPAGAARVLDAGCGIGFSTWHIKRHLPGCDVVGLDQSPEMVRWASLLHRRDGLSFVVGDLAERDTLPEGPFDAVVMLDVYEHVPRAQRASAWEAIAGLLADDGRLILSYPSVASQAFLRQNHPERLQPVDEDVTDEDLRALAAGVGASVVSRQDVKVWRKNDYVHAVIGRQPAEPSAGAGGTMASRTKPDVETIRVRRQRLQETLGIRVSRTGLALAENRDGPVVCVATPAAPRPSETFLRAHLRCLPARVRHLSGASLATLAGFEDEPLYRLPASRDWLRRLPLAVRRRVLGQTHAEIGARALQRHLARHGVQAVLAEYGPTGVLLMDVCRRLDLPLIVHFHGADAYKEGVIRVYAERYRRLFETAAAVVAVSHDMERQLLELGAPRARLHCNPCGVDLARFTATDPGRNPPHFLAVGRFVDKKAPCLTLLAFQRTLAAVPGATLTMVGEGALLESCRRMAEGLGIAASVSFRGACSHGEVGCLMRTARAFVQHSVRPRHGEDAGDSEGTPVAVLEAGATGLPVVATRHGGIPDVVAQGETGYLVEEGDVAGMARHMTALASDPGLASRMGGCAREHAASHCGMDHSIARLGDIIRGAMA